MVAWKQKLAIRQKEIAQKFLEETSKWLIDSYTDLTEEITQNFMSVYNEMLYTLNEKQKPTPADLYKLTSYWELQKTIKEILQTTGKEIHFYFNTQLKNMYIEVYEGIVPLDKEKICLISEEKIQELIDKTWGREPKNLQERIWIKLTVLWDKLFGSLMDCVIKNRTPKDLKELLQEEISKNRNILMTLFSDETTHLRAYSAMHRYKDDYRTADDELAFLGSYINTYGNEEEMEAYNTISLAYEKYAIAGADEDEGEGGDEGEEDTKNKNKGEEYDRWEIIGSHGCEPCADLDGLIWTEDDENGPVPVPVHPNCQCSIIPCELSAFADMAEDIAGSGFSSAGEMLGKMTLIAALITLGVAVGDDYSSGRGGVSSEQEWLEKWGDRYPV